MLLCFDGALAPCRMEHSGIRLNVFVTSRKHPF
nr:MAG TPA: hypothetical protein [Microviridae sp.]